jgi:UDP-N-acetylglucosamine--N-acetylmuramyl-(pentapeptide) pyrophosphoryl-undecaprenol N-acetylglucosamine transferase
VKIIIAGGGTGGHLFPGIAVAEEFLKRNRQNHILFIGTERGLEKKILGNLGFELCTLDVEGIKGRGLKRIFGALFKLPRSIMQSYRIIRNFRPGMVLGVGGYASGPAVITAHFMGIRTAIMEQNALPGMTNSILGKFVDRIFLTFPDTEKRFPDKKTTVCGNPVRASFFTENRHRTGDEEKFTILVFGGSQGAHAINNAILEALPHLKNMEQTLRIIHQTGEKDIDNVFQNYQRHGMDAEILPFIIDMAQAYRSSDLLICRAGATSIAEITATGKAAILIPFPFAVNDHQTKNAEVLVRAGAAVMMEEKYLDGKKLAETIAYLCRHSHIIKEMEGHSAGLGNIKAASDIVDICIKMAE